MDQGAIAMKPVAPASMATDLAASLRDSILPLTGRTGPPPFLWNAYDPGLEYHLFFIWLQDPDIRHGSSLLHLRQNLSTLRMGRKAAGRYTSCNPFAEILCNLNGTRNLRGWPPRLHLNTMRPVFNRPSCLSGYVPVQTRVS